MNKQNPSNKHRLTLRQLAAELRDHGIPIGDSTLAKLCSPAINEGPPVACYWGKRPLYDFDQALLWAEARLSSAEDPTNSPSERSRRAANRKHRPAAAEEATI